MEKAGGVLFRGFSLSLSLRTSRGTMREQMNVSIAIARTSIRRQSELYFHIVGNRTAGDQREVPFKGS